MTLDPKLSTLVGKLILQDKAQYWDGQHHYHHLMKAGDSTLNAQCANFVLRYHLENKQFDESHYIDNYFKFVTRQPAAHNDCYAEGFHRTFLLNHLKGLPLLQCGEETPGTASMGGLVMVAPLVIAKCAQGVDKKSIQAVAERQLRLTNPSPLLQKYSSLYVSLLFDLLSLECKTGDNNNNKERMVQARQLVRQVGTELGIDLAALVAEVDGSHGGNDDIVFGTKYSRACPIEKSFPCVLYMAYKYLDGDRFASGVEATKRALISNTNVGGENCHRGSVLGSILGAATASELTDWNSQLKLHDSLEQSLQVLQKS